MELSLYAYGADKLELNPNVPKSPKDFLDSLEGYFQFSKEGKIEKVRELIQSKGGMRQFVLTLFPEVLPGISWENTESLSTEQILKLLQKLGDFGQHILDNNKAECGSLINDQAVVPLVAAGLYFFHPSHVTVQDMFGIENFFTKDLLNRFFRKNARTQEAERIATEASQTYQTLYKMLKLVLDFAYITKTPEQEYLPITETIVTLLQNHRALSGEKVSEMHEEIERVLVSGETKGGKKETLEILKKILQKFFPTEFCSQVTQARYKLCILGNPEAGHTNGLFRFCSAKNFYFERDDEKEPGPNDQFPVSGAVLYNGSGGFKNISIFDIYGKKVFWGDFNIGEISHLTGTYFILSEDNSILSVPVFAKTAESLFPADDPNFAGSPETRRPRDIVRINPDYMRFVAKGKIQDGKFIENSRSEHI